MRWKFFLLAKNDFFKSVLRKLDNEQNSHAILETSGQISPSQICEVPEQVSVKYFVIQISPFLAI